MTNDKQTLAERQNVSTRLRRTRDYLRGELAKATRHQARLTDEIVTVEELIERADADLHAAVALEAS